MPFISLGAFILIFGFFAFNGGSQGRISSSGDGSVVALAITNTLLGCIGGGLAVLFIIKIFKGGKWSLIQLVNGCLAGLNKASFLLLQFTCTKGVINPNGNRHSAFKYYVI